MRKITAKIILILSLMILVTSCNTTEKISYEKYSGSFFDTFDTVTQVVGYTETEAEFQMYYDQIQKRFQELHKLYDIYNSYEGINNIKTINDNAGIKPVKVDKEIIDLLLFCKEWYDVGLGKTNIAMGALLDIWHEYREQGLEDPMNAALPSEEELQEAAKHMNMDDIIIDTENSTVFLADKDMRINAGAVAKGYATEIVAQEAKAAGFSSLIISAGGNVRAMDKPLDGVRERWGVGIQNPDMFVVVQEENMVDTVFLTNASVVTSGDYQRYYVVNGEVVHHLIDPATLRPANYYRAATVITENSGLADFLSTVVFTLPYEESRKFVENLNGVEALWIMPDGEIRATEGMEKMMKSKGATGGKK